MLVFGFGFGFGLFCLFLGIFPVLVIVVTRVGERGVLFFGGVNLSFFVAGWDLCW